MHTDFGQEMMKQKVNAQIASFIVDNDSAYDTSIARQMVQNVAQLSPKTETMLAETDSIVDAVKEDQKTETKEPETKNVDISDGENERFMGKSSFKPSEASKSSNPFRTSRIHEKVNDIAQKLNFTNSILSSLSNQ